MSIARDDLGISGVLNALKAEFIKPGTLEKQNNKEVSGSENKESEINDVFEKKSSGEEKDIEQLQDEYNSLEIKKQALEEVDSSLESIEKSGQNPDNVESFDRNIEELDRVIEEMAPEKTKSEEQKENGNTEEQSLAREDAQQNNESSRKINELRAKVSEKQQQLANLQQKLYNEVSSIVELRIGNNTDSIETEQKKAEELRESVERDIKENPEKVQKIQITNLNKDLILAMLSLRQ